MALDPFAGFSAEARKRGYDPLAVMAGLGVGRARAGELAMEREKLDREAQQQAADMQLRARQMEQEAAAQTARREYEMKQLGMTETQQRQEAELQQRQLDRQFAEMQSNEAYRQASLAQAPQLAAQQYAAQAERDRLAREADAAEALLTRQAQMDIERMRQKTDLDREKRLEARDIASEKRLAAMPQKEVIAAILSPIESVNELTGVKTSTPPSAAQMLERALTLKAGGVMVPDELITRFQRQVAPAPGAKGGLSALRQRLGATSAPALSTPARRTPVQEGRVAQRVQQALGVPMASSVARAPLSGVVGSSISVSPLDVGAQAAAQQAAARRRSAEDQAAARYLLGL